jgi:CheY-like chemotaxis protein
MNRKGRVLVVDDLKRWREELVDTLQHNGFHADSASSATSVLERLDETFYHLLLLDIRLVDDDPNNKDGLELLPELYKRGLSDAFKIIILSAYGTKEYMRLAFKDYKVTDFLSKDDFTRQLFLESVRQAFTEDVQINLALNIIWQNVKGPEQAVNNLEINGKKLKRNPVLLGQIATELDDLLCRLFNQADSILVKPLTQGQSSTGILRVQPFYSSGGGHSVIVKFGDFRQIEEEHDNFKRYVQPFIGGGRNTTILNKSRTPHLGGVIYSLLGTDDEHLEDFGSFYQRAETPQINAVLDHLFLDTCGAWYANPGQLKPYDLTADYQGMFAFTYEKLEHAVFQLQKTVTVGQKLFFKSLSCEHPFTNPLQRISGSPFVYPTYTCITHGDFNQHNLLVDANGHTWLIDFQSTGPGHILRDIAQLDSEIRFLLLTTDEATLDERLAMEELLCSVARFSQLPQLVSKLSTSNAALAKAYETVVHLRFLAGKLVAQNPRDDISEYAIALYYNAMNTLRFYALPSRQREHALLCASLLVNDPGLKG